MSATTPYQGQPVVYTLSQADADFITDRRTDTGTGGNPLAGGDSCPAVIVKLHNPTYANLIVLLDGPDTFWCTSRTSGNPGDQNTWYVHTDDVAVPLPAPAGTV